MITLEISQRNYHFNVKSEHKNEYNKDQNVFYRVRQIIFFLENALKKTTEYFLKFLFLFKILPVNNGK